MDRRTVLKGGIAVALSAHTAVAASEISMPTISELIEAHAHAMALDSAAWSVAADISQELEENGHDLPKVEVGKTYLGRDDEGKDITRTNYAYSAEEIRAKFNRHCSAQLGMAPPKATDPRANIQQQYDERMNAKLAELENLEKEYQRREDDSGLTKAHKHAFATMARVRSVETEIVEFVPETFSDAVRKAAWCAWAYNNNGTYLHDNDDATESLVKALAAIGRASA